MSKERRLGRGLAALLGTPVDENGPDIVMPEPVTPMRVDAAMSPGPVAALEAEQAGDRLLQLSVYEIDNNPFQPRRDFSEPEIASLAESLKSHDMLQPVLVRRNGARYQLISGERRLRAAIAAGWAHVPARVRDVDDRLAAELAIVENLQREDLNPIEKALSFGRYLNEHACTQEDLAARLKIDRSTIANLMRLLELPDAVQEAVRTKSITAGHARALLPLGSEADQSMVCEQIKRDGLSVRQVEQIVNDILLADEPESMEETEEVGGVKKKKRPKSEQIAALEQELRVLLGAKVEIKTSGRGKGKLIISFRSHEEFERICEQFGDQPKSRSRAG